MLEKIWIGIQEQFLHREVCQALKLASQESGVVAIPQLYVKDSWHLGTWFSAAFVSVSVTEGLNELNSLFQLEPFCSILVFNFCLVHW